MADDSRQLNRELANAQHAEHLLDNPLFEEIWTRYEATLVQALKSLPPRDAEGRQAGVLALQVLEAVKRAVMESVETGKLARMTLEQRETIANRAKSWIGRDGLSV